MTLAIDFDGTIVEHRYLQIGREIPFAIATLKRLQEERHRLILWTVREGKLLEEAVEFCRARGLEFYAVNCNFPEEKLDVIPACSCRKLKADFFIDDRNLGGLPDWGVIYKMVHYHWTYEQVQGPLVDLSRQIPAFTQAVTSVERLQELLAIPRETAGEEVRLQGPVGVRLEGVTFAYPEGDCPVLEQFSHDFMPGSLTAIVGETGAGKSTLLRLVLALLEPEQGKVVLYDGHCEVTASPATRCNLSYVPQGNTLVSGTIRENLRMGNPKATDGELREALYTAAAEFVFDLPEGLDSLCSERGAGLSEGQAQRIAIARGLLRPGQVLLLDEPTSALDEATERLLLQRLHACLGNRTLLLITHHEAVARHCTHRVRLQRS